MTTDTTTTIQIPNVPDYSFVLPNSTEALVVPGSTFNRTSGSGEQKVVLAPIDLPSTNHWLAVAPAALPGRIRNTVADALNSGWVVTVTHDSYHDRWTVQVTPDAATFAAHLWLSADAHRRSTGSQYWTNVRSGFALRLVWHKVDGKYRWSEEQSRTCGLDTTAEDGKIFVTFDWSSSWTKVLQKTLVGNKDTVGLIDSAAPAVVQAEQAEQAVAVVQAAADDAAFADALAEYEATGRQQHDRLRDLLTTFADTTADDRQRYYTEASAKAFANNNDDSAAEHRQRAQGYAAAQQVARSVLAAEAQRWGAAGVTSLADALAVGLSDCVKAGLSTRTGWGVQHTIAARWAYEVLVDLVRPVIKVSSPTVVVEVR